MIGTAPWGYLLYRSLWSGLDWIFPPVCAGCGRPGSRWCADCQAAVIPPAEPLCPRCGLPLAQPGLCPTCVANPPSFDLLRSWLIFEGPIRKALHRLKYRRDLGLGDALAEGLDGCLRQLGWTADLVVPMPLGRRRMRERGYNQVGLVARPLALARGWRYAPAALRRARETASQVGLSAEERRLNVRGAFRASERLVRGRQVLLLDDVATTGATLTEAARALRDAGAAGVNCLTIARALPRHGLKDV